MSKITLFDLPSNGRCACWSLNPWKTRLVLNYKGIPYQTTWVEYPNVEPTLKPHLPPNPPGSRAYTIPTIILPSAPHPSYITESLVIARALEAAHPSPSLHLDSPLLPLVMDALSRIQQPLTGVWMPEVPKLLNPISAEYFRRTRAVSYGMSVEEFRVAKGGEPAWEAAAPGVKEMGELLGRNEGPFVEGETVSYADFVIASFLKFVLRLDEAAFKRLVGMEPTFSRLYVACEGWMERDDH